MQILVSWQLSESAEIKRIRRELNEVISDDTMPLEVEVLGEDTSGSRYYYIGSKYYSYKITQIICRITSINLWCFYFFFLAGVRIYRETMISGRIKWETVSSTVGELRKFIYEYQGIDPSRSDQERGLYNKFITTVLPNLEPLENVRTFNNIIFEYIKRILIKGLLLYRNDKGSEKKSCLKRNVIESPA